MGLDTSLQRCSVAILRGAEVLGDAAEDMERGHAERLAPMTAGVLARAGVKLADLDRIGVVVGPGGFTGVRAALAFARGLGLASGVAVAGVTSLAALAAAVPGEGPVAAVIDARRGQVYAGLYGEGGEIIAPPFVAGAEDALKTLKEKAGAAPLSLVGSGAGLLGALPAGWKILTGLNAIDPCQVARLAAKAPPPEGPPPPLYLRAPDAKPGRPGPLDGIAAG
ncbi:MAG: tRNA (adenosine(37)-N6)-threonylcarbamoyltransferase complex dimerization subunit type 1 TsaB [Parvularculaceae bacterium]